MGLERELAPEAEMAEKDDSKERAGLLIHTVSKDALKPGDHIYVYRVLPLPYAHHGIYIGEPGMEVIHFCGEKRTGNAQIQSCTLKEFTKYCIFVHLVAYDASPFATLIKTTFSYNQRKSRPAEDVVETAKYYLENPQEYRRYHLFFNNCETFAIYCKADKVGLKSIPIISVLGDIEAWVDNANYRSVGNDME